MIFHSAQSKVARSAKRFRVVCAGRRGGKTELAVNEMAGKAFAAKGRHVKYIAPTFQQARDIAWVRLLEVVKPIAIKINETRLEIQIQTADKGRSTISLGGWESIDTLRGQAFDFLVIDEIASMRNWEENWSTVIRPTLTHREGRVLFISTPKGFNHFYDLYNLAKDPIRGADYESFHFTSYDNPHNKAEELEKARKELSEDQFAQEYMADFRKQTGLIYKEFDRVKHVFSDDALILKAKANHSYILVGIDWGYTNPCAILKCYKDRDSHYWFVEEYYKTGKTDDEINEYSKSLQGNLYYPDPAEPDRVEKLRALGMNVRDVSKDVEAGISAVRALFKEDRIHIHFSLVHTIEELESYRYREKKADKNAPEQPVKEDDHAMDAMRYILYMQDPAGMRRKSRQYVPDHRGGANRVMKRQ